jgi:hypothetical protein
VQLVHVILLHQAQQRNAVKQMQAVSVQARLPLLHQETQRRFLNGSTSASAGQAAFSASGAAEQRSSNCCMLRKQVQQCCNSMMYRKQLLCWQEPHTLQLREDCAACVSGVLGGGHKQQPPVEKQQQQQQYLSSEKCLVFLVMPTGFIFS